jgi:SAM-dependent methyltransferase
MQMLGTTDAYGHALYDSYHGEDVQVFVERDDGFIDTDAMIDIYFEDPSETDDAVREALDKAEGRVLDIGCGAGRHALYLQRQGLDVVGIDNSPLAIQLCRERGLKDARVLSIDDISPALGRFDAIVMLGNNFGLFGSRKRMRRILKKLDGITGDNACIYAECLDPYDTDFPCHLRYHKFNLQRDRMGGQLRIRIRYENHATPWFDYLFASRDEIRELVAKTAWRVSDFAPDDGASFVVSMTKR